MPVSFVLHASLMAFVLISFAETKPFKPPEPALVEVDVITSDGLKQLKEGSLESKQLEVEAAKPAPTSTAFKEPLIAKQPAPARPAPRQPERKPDPAPKIAMAPDPVRPAVQRPMERRETDRDKELDALERALKDQGPAPPTPSSPAPAPSVANGPTRVPVGDKDGRDKEITTADAARLGPLIKQAVSKCWKIQTGAEGIETIVIKLEVQLRPDGHLLQPPKILNTMPGPLFADTANSAVRAVVQCGPYSFPPELYKGGWENMIWTFDPRKMF